MMPSDAELLKMYLADRDVACPGCGYSLRGCVNEKCPECGKAIRIVIEDRSPLRGLVLIVRASAVAIICNAAAVVRAVVIEVNGEGWTLGAAPYGLVLRYWIGVGSECFCAVLCLYVLWLTLWSTKSRRNVRLARAEFYFLIAVLVWMSTRALVVLGERLFEW